MKVETKKIEKNLNTYSIKDETEIKKIKEQPVNTPIHNHTHTHTYHFK